MAETSWRAVIAERIVLKIISTCGDKMPRSTLEWEQACTQIGLTLHIMDCGGPFEACLVDSLVFVRRSLNFSVMSRRISHEVAEWLLRQDREAPFVVDGDYLHEIAKLVESYIDTDQMAG